MNKVYKFLAQISPFFLIKKLIKTNIIFPFYHIISDNDVPHVKHLYRIKSVSEFKKDLDFFLKHYSPISILDLYEHIYLEKKLPTKSFLLTFDDGFSEVNDIIAPLLKAKGIPAVFFISTDFIDNRKLFFRCKVSLLIDRIHISSNLTIKKEDKIKNILIKNNIFFYDIIKSIFRIGYHKKDILNEISKIIGVNFESYLKKFQPYLSSEQIKKLIDNGFFIGAHSIDHPPYKLLSLAEQIKQTKDSIDFLKHKFNLHHSFFAFPFNDKEVSRQFFHEAREFIDISFGTGGFHSGNYFNNYQRIPMEIPKLSVQNIIKMFFLEHRGKSFNR